MRKYIAFIFLAFLTQPVYAVDAVAFKFASLSQGQQILTTRDEFVRSLSPFDRAARLKSSSEISEGVYLRSVASNVRDWSDSEKGLVGSATKLIQPSIDALHLSWPDSITLVKTMGNEEGGAAYTRGNAIVIPHFELMKNKKEGMARLIAHELFHILTHRNQRLRDELYATIGFYPCGELVFPPSLSKIKITNPDAVRNQHCIRLDIAGSKKWAVPIMYARKRAYDISEGGEFFDYLLFRFLILEGDGATPPKSMIYDDAKLQLIEHHDVGDFFEQIGGNTDYVVHPEEILADNFAILVSGDIDVTSPEIISKMKKVLGEFKN